MSGNRPGVIVVDDEFLIRYTVCQTVIEVGADALDYSNAEEALEAISREFFALCFLDLRLPGMSGLEALKSIRNLSPKTRVVLMTGSMLNNKEEASVRRSADYFLPKPFSLLEVRGIAQDALRTFVDAEKR